VTTLALPQVERLPRPLRLLLDPHAKRLTTDKTLSHGSHDRRDSRNAAHVPSCRYIGQTTADRSGHSVEVPTTRHCRPWPRRRPVLRAWLRSSPEFVECVGIPPN